MAKEGNVERDMSLLSQKYTFPLNLDHKYYSWAGEMSLGLKYLVHMESTEVWIPSTDIKAKEAGHLTAHPLKVRDRASLWQAAYIDKSNQ